MNSDDQNNPEKSGEFLNSPESHTDSPETIKLPMVERDAEGNFYYRDELVNVTQDSENNFFMQVESGELIPVELSPYQRTSNYESPKDRLNRLYGLDTEGPQHDLTDRNAPHRHLDLSPQPSFETPSLETSPDIATPESASIETELTPDPEIADRSINTFDKILFHDPAEHETQDGITYKRDLLDLLATNRADLRACINTLSANPLTQNAATLIHDRSEELFGRIDEMLNNVDADYDSLTQIYRSMFAGVSNSQIETIQSSLSIDSSNAKLGELLSSSNSIPDLFAAAAVISSARSAEKTKLESEVPVRTIEITDDSPEIPIFSTPEPAPDFIETTPAINELTTPDHTSSAQISQHLDAA